LRAYARFFAAQRPAGPEAPVVLPFDELTPDEQAAAEALETELLALRSLVTGDPAEEEPAFSRSWHFSDGAHVTVICAELPGREKGPQAEPSDPNYTDLQRYADLDALMEIFGHIRAENPQATVRFKIPADIEPDDLTGHVVMVGGVVWNEIAGRLSQMSSIPIRQYSHPKLQTGEIFSADVDGNEKIFWPKWADAKRSALAEDVGLLARVPNPLNSSRTLTVCNGIHSRGVYGAVRSLTDQQLREANERYIANAFESADSFAILMAVPVIKNRGMTPDFNSDGVVLYQWRSPEK
jgi:hypothetical protein